MGKAMMAAMTLASAAAATDVHAADAKHGNSLYHDAAIGCFGCHGADPRRDPMSAINLGVNWQNIQDAINFRVPDMAFLSVLQLTVDDLQDIAAYLQSVFGTTTAPPPDMVTVVEYHHAEFDHYFVTANADEISKLDTGVFAGWTRTGQTFNGLAAPGDQGAAVCRFFSTAFGIRSSHFYTSSSSECATVKQNPDWQYEGVVFSVLLPAADGTCPAGSIPVYRLYNNGQGGAPNHRLTTSLSTRSDMIAKHWVPEGLGVGVTMCSPQ